MNDDAEIQALREKYGITPVASGDDRLAKLRAAWAEEPTEPSEPSESEGMTVFGNPAETLKRSGESVYSAIVGEGEYAGKNDIYRGLAAASNTVSGGIELAADVIPYGKAALGAISSGFDWLGGLGADIPLIKELGELEAAGYINPKDTPEFYKAKQQLEMAAMTGNMANIPLASVGVSPVTGAISRGASAATRATTKGAGKVKELGGKAASTVAGKVEEAIKPTPFKDVYTKLADSTKTSAKVLKETTFKYKGTDGVTKTVNPLDTLESLSSVPKIQNTYNGFKLSTEPWLEELSARQTALNNSVTAAVEHHVGLPKIQKVSIKELRARAIEELKRDTEVTDVPARKITVEREVNELLDVYDKIGTIPGQIDAAMLNRFRIGANREAQAYYDAQRLGAARGTPPRISGDTAKAYEILAGVFRDELTTLRPEIDVLLTKERAVMMARKFATQINRTTVGPGLVARIATDVAGGAVGATLGGGVFSPLTGAAGAALTDKVLEAYLRRQFTGYKKPDLRSPQNSTPNAASPTSNSMDSTVAPKPTDVNTPLGKLENERLMREGNKSIPKEGSTEAILEQATGWQAGDRAIFDTAMKMKDKGVIYEMIKEGRVPPEYQARFTKEIDAILGPKGEGGGPNTLQPAVETSYTLPNQQVAKAFKGSKEQVAVGPFELGTFGKNSARNKAVKGDRFSEKELPDTINNVTEAYKASDDPRVFRSGNVVWIAKMPDGTQRAIYTRVNPAGKEEIINWHTVSNPKYIEDLKKFGIPERARTSNLIGRNDTLYPLSYGDDGSIAQTAKDGKTKLQFPMKEGQSFIDKGAAGASTMVALMGGDDTPKGQAKIEQNINTSIKKVASLPPQRIEAVKKQLTPKLMAAALQVVGGPRVEVPEAGNANGPDDTGFKPLVPELWEAMGVDPAKNWHLLPPLMLRGGLAGLGSFLEGMIMSAGQYINGVIKGGAPKGPTSIPPEILAKAKSQPGFQAYGPSAGFTLDKNGGISKWPEAFFIVQGGFWDMFVPVDHSKEAEYAFRNLRHNEGDTSTKLIQAANDLMTKSLKDLMNVRRFPGTNGAPGLQVVPSAPQNYGPSTP